MEFELKLNIPVLYFDELKCGDVFVFCDEGLQSPYIKSSSILAIRISNGTLLPIPKPMSVRLIKGRFIEGAE